MKEIRDFQAFEEIKNQDKPVVLDFYADWCGPCQAMLPTVEALADEYADDAVIAKVNVDHFRDLAVQFGVRSIPAIFVRTTSKDSNTTTGHLARFR